MVKFRKKLTELNVDKAQLSRSLRKGIEEYEEMEAAFERNTNELASGDLAEEDQLETEERNAILTQGMAAMDEELERKVINWDKNKELNAQRSNNLKSSKRNGKKVATPAPVAEPAAEPPVVAGTAGTTVIPLGVPTADEPADPPVVAEPAEPDEDKEASKGSSAAMWGFGIFATVLTLGLAYKYFRKNK